MVAQHVARPTRTINPWYVAVVAGLASFVDGAALSVNGVALVIYQQTIGLSAAEVGLLTGTVTFGLAVGALVGGRAGDVFGRRKIFLITMVVIVVGSLAPTFGSNFWVLFAGLSLLGFGVGADLPVSLATIAEVATDKNRGTMLVFTQLMWVMASILVLVITSTTGDLGRVSGQILYGMIAAVALIGLLMRLTVPESKVWLQGREERRQGARTVRATNARLRDLFRVPLLRPTLVLAVSYALLSVAGNVAASYVIYVAVNVAEIPLSLFTGYYLLAVPATLLGLVLMLKIVSTRARLPVFVGGGIVFVAGFFIPAIFGINLFTLVLAAVIVGFGSVLCGEPIARVWANESFPTMLRSTGQGLVFTIGRVVVAAVSALAPSLIALSPQAFFVALAGSAAVGVLVAYIGFRGGRIRNEFGHEEKNVTTHSAPGNQSG